MIYWEMARRFGPFVLIGVLLVVVLGQCSRIEHKNEVIAHGEQALEDEQNARKNDRALYREEQELAAHLEQLRLDQAVQQQKEINDDAANRYEARIAGLDTHLAGLRREVRNAATLGRAGQGEPVSGVPDAARGADAEAGLAYAPCDRACLTALIRYDELISWVERQAEVPVSP